MITQWENRGISLSSPWPGFNFHPWQSISRDFSRPITFCQPLLSQRGRKWLNLPSMALHNLWTSRRKAEIQPWIDKGRKKTKCSPNVLAKRWLQVYLNSGCPRVSQIDWNHVNVKIRIGNYIKSESPMRPSVWITVTTSQHIFLFIAKISPESPHPNALGRFVWSSRRLRVCSDSTARCRCIGFPAGQRVTNSSLSENVYCHSP